jgi:ribonuclease Z
VELTFLGTSAGVPTPERNVSATALRLEGGGVWLVDCGEGTQQRLLASRLRPSRLERVLLTHLHGDHCFGLPGLLASLGMWGRRDEVEVVGPEGLRTWLETTLRISGARLAFPLTLREIPPAGGALPARSGLETRALPLVHRLPSFAFELREPPRRGHLDADRARALGVASGPALGRHAAGAAVALPDGRRIEPRQVLGPSRPGRRLVLCGDSADSSALLALEPGMDLLVHECTFAARDAAKAARYSHSTSEDVGALARALRPRQLVITHLSSRYTTPAADPDVDALRREVEAACPGVPVTVARDHLVLAVPAREAAAPPATAAPRAPV